MSKPNSPRPCVIGNIICWLFLALFLLAVLAVMIDERCSRNADAWAREFGDMVSEKLSGGE